jgi:ketosteroid isomerase-like protein
MDDDVTWQWMGTKQWSRSLAGKQAVIDSLFGGSADSLPDGSSVDVHEVHSDGDVVIVEHSGHNLLPDGRTYDNNYCWVFRYRDGRIQEVREYMDTQLVSDTFGVEKDA